MLFPCVTLASQSFIGHFTTVTESECNSEIILLSNGTGTFIDTCRREDGSHIDDVEKYNITWNEQGNGFITKIKGNQETFIYKEALSCKDFGSTGSANGLVGYSTHFWRSPIKCN